MGLLFMREVSMTKKTISKIIALILIFTVISGCGFTSLATKMGKQVREQREKLQQDQANANAATKEPSSEQVLPNNSAEVNLGNDESLLEALYKHVSPGVVSIQIAGASGSW